MVIGLFLLEQPWMIKVLGGVVLKFIFDEF